MTEGKYSFSARKAGKNCDFQFASDAREEVIAKAKEHVASCNVCADLKEEQLAAAIEQRN
ncbi:MAG: DUF1059 domain-containing protein [Candidatus Marsarchaeota archaeon]|jgi:predicted small metal-binding protein|nr:DUF1059 domain-containing protein [Candidatus Marsarchaeota archaeon]